MVKLAEPVSFNDYIRPICLPTSGVLNVQNGDVVGWGITDDTRTISNTPREVNLPIVNDIECLKRDRGLLDIAWTESFCAGKNGSGVCEGDSGSGFYIEKNGVFYLRGIVS